MGDIVSHYKHSRGVFTFVLGLFIAGWMFAASPLLAAGGLEQEFVYRVSFGRADDVSLLLSRGADVDTVNEQGMPMLAVAADRTDKEALPIVQLLVHAGAKIDKADKEGHYPLLNAIRKNNLEIVTYLIEQGASVTVRDDKGYDARTIASQLDKGDILKVIDEKIAADEAELQRLKSPQNLNRLIREYASAQCESQYWAYFMASKQDPSRDIEIEQKLDVLEVSTANTAAEIFRLFTARPEDLSKIANDTRKAVFGELEQLISIRNRKAHGVGTLEDADKRCRRLANSWAAEYTAPPKK